LLASGFQKNSNGSVTKRKPKIIQDKKLRGEWAEMQFMARTAEHGLPVSKPWGEMTRFDFVVGTPRHFVSVQVKSTAFKMDAGYNCTVRGSHTAYRPGSFDFLAALVVPEDAWYIIPAAAIRGKDSINFYPGSKTSKYEQYREAWHFLREAAGAGADHELHDQGQADQDRSVEDVKGGELLGEKEREPSAANPPTGAVGRMQAVESYVRNFFERGSAGPQKLRKEAREEDT
jgi:hypothetical protein